MNRKYQFTTFVLTILLAGFVFAHVSFAQTTPPPANPPAAPASGSADITLSRAEIEAADKSQAICEGDFRKKVSQFGVQIDLRLTTVFKTMQSSPKAVPVTSCTITNQKDSPDSEAASYINATVRSATVPLSSSKAGNAIETYPLEQTSFWKRIVNFVLTGIQSLMAMIMGRLAAWAGQLLLFIISNTTNTIEPKIVGTGWLIIRDFMNLFFIFGLIIIGLATILRMESYNYKKLLVQLILMALLINFSKVIATTIIGFFDMLINVIKGSGQGDQIFDYLAFFDKVLHPSGSLDGLFGGSTTGAVVNAYSAMFAAGVAIIAFLVLSAMFVVRMIGLWFLIMVSPAAYALNILPQTKGLAQRWWSTFFKYLIWGPVALLFIKLGNLLIQNSGSEPIMGFSDSLDFVFIGAFLWGAVYMVKNAGMYGSGAIMGVANKTINKAKGWNRAAHGAAGSYFARGTAAKHAGLVAGGLIGGQNNKYGKGIQKAGETTGKWIGTKTAQMQAMPQAFKEYFAIGDRARTKQIKDEKLTALVNSGVKLDKDVYGQLSAKHIIQMAKRGIKPDQVADIIEHKGRVGADTLMLAMKDGMLDAVEKNDDKEAIKNAVTKAYFTNRNVKEFEYEQNADKFKILADKGGISKSGALKSGEEWEVFVKDKEGNIVKDDKGNNQIDQSKSVKYAKWRTDNRKVEIVIPKRDVLDSISAEEMATKSNDELKNMSMSKGKSRIYGGPPNDNPNTLEQKAEMRKNNEQIRKEIEKDREDRKQNPPTSTTT